MTSVTSDTTPVAVTTTSALETSATLPASSATTSSSGDGLPLDSSVPPNMSDVASSSQPDSSEAVSDISTGSDSTEVLQEFDIVLEFLPSAQSLSDDVRAAFLRAEVFWERIVVGDLPDVSIDRRQVCTTDGAETAALEPGLVDDLHIFVAAKAIDGVDGVLGAAGPCLSHSSRNNLPLAGYMQFDTADLQRYSDEGRLDEIIAHEMGHVLGFGGTLWGQPQPGLGGVALLADPAGGGGTPLPDTHFVGPKAVAEFDAVGGSSYSGAKVPVENTGGQGTVNGHWREDVMGNELMTSFMTNRDGILSSVTIAALEDMGYTVNYAASEDYVWPPPDPRSPLFRAQASEGLAPVNFGNDVLQIPIRDVDEPE